MAILTKYSRTQDTQSAQYTTQKEYIDSLRTDVSVSVPDDFRTPFTYNEWLQRNAGIIPGKEYDQYNQYLKSWHQNTYTRSDTIEQVKEDYYALLNELSVAFTSPEEAAWFAQLDITNDLDLEEAIPVFTKKLKEIAIYFINKRDAIKKAKLKYNMVGSRNALKRLFYEYLLKAFTQRQYVLNVPEQSAYNTFPYLSAVSNGFQIFIEELYDDTEYFDKDPTVPVSSYYNLTDENLIAYYNTVSFDVSAAPWLFGTGMMSVYADNPLLWTLSGILESYNVSGIDALPLSAFSAFDGKLLNDYVRMTGTQKYLGEEQYIISGGYFELDSKIVTHNFTSGNNWFYWPSGEYYRENQDDVVFDPVFVTESSLIDDGAVASTSYETADKVFTQVGQSISGAWLRYTDKFINDQVMQATLFSKENTIFRFPFPGYGLSGEGTPWTGPQLINALPYARYDEVVANTYWNTMPTSATNAISIHKTTLIDSGAVAGSEYKDADKINIRETPNVDRIHDTNPNATYKEGFDRAWLYKMTKTDLPVTVGQTYINWPVHTYKKDDTTLAYAVPSSQCTEITLSSINVEDTMVGARAGHGVFDSDLIYKLDSWNGYPTECAWLSGIELDRLAGNNSLLMYNVTGKIQPSLTLRCRPGNETRFVWYDTSTIIDKTSIIHHKHQEDCPYYLNNHKSILATKGTGYLELGTNGIGDWNDCRCRAIKYSPLGHPGQKFSDYGSMADFIFVDTQFPNSFDISTWRGTDLSSYDTSKDFAWFQLATGNNVEPDVGWGPGTWKTGSGAKFQFRPGVIYKYVRANLHRNPGDLVVGAVPDLIIKQKHTSTPPSKWMKAELNEEGNWQKTETPSTMILKPGDYVMYDHIDSVWFCVSTAGDLGTTYSQEPSTVNYGTNWANYDYVTIGNDVQYLWPEKLYTGGPEHVAAQLSAVTWILTPPTGTNLTVEKIDPANLFKFTTEIVGTYSVNAIGYGTFGSESVTISPDLSCVLPIRVESLSGSLGVQTTYMDTINMTVNVPLTGWNYTTKQFNGESRGARPFWAKAYDTSNDQTKSKATISWGGGIRTLIDDYTFITQPDIATLSLSSNYYVEYLHQGNSSLTWSQPVEFLVNEEKKQWCKLIINPSKASPLSQYLYNITNEMVVSATETESDLYFDNSSEMFVNYWSVGEGFTWNQQIINSTNGLPPTGGRWITPISGELVTPLVPYANLTNRHYPTIATAPYIGNLYTTEDSGGYFTPKTLGATVYIGRDWTNTIDATVLNNDVSARGLTATFRNPERYIGNDRGLTMKNQLSPIVDQDIDQRWQKGGITEGFKAGDVVGVREYQEYIPYQTKYESTTFNFNGLRTQNDEYDPWTGDADKIWSDPTYFPPNFRDEYDILGWYNNKLPENVFIYQWKTDIFGNQYALLKPDTLNGVYDKRQAYGDLWMRNQENIIAPISAIFPTYNTYQDSISSVSYTLKDFDLWYDTLMLQSSSHVIVEHMLFDWSTGRLYTIADEVNVIDIDAENGGRYAGHWLFDEEKHVTLCQVLSDAANNTVYPVLYTYDLDAVERTTLLNLSGNSQINALSALNLSHIEDPTFTYNKNTKTYNVTFVGYSDMYSGILITTMNIGHIEGLKSIHCVTPNLSS